MSESDDLSQYTVDSPMQIGRILDALARNAEIVTAYFEHGREFLLTAVVDVDVAGRRVRLDQSTDPALNARLLASDRVVLVTAHEKVKVQFAAQRVRAVEFDGRPAFEIDLPRELLKLQRREQFRVRAAANAPVRCRVPLGDQVVDLQVIDISVGGIAAYGRLPAGHVRVGVRFSGAMLEVGEEGSLVSELELRSSADARLADRPEIARMGFRFVNPSAEAQKLVQRYILKVERDRRSRDLDLGK